LFDGVWSLVIGLNGFEKDEESHSRRPIQYRTRERVGRICLLQIRQQHALSA
jgi:hypothetical protein